MTMNCRNGFSLLEPHVCTLDPSLQPPPKPSYPVDEVISQNNDPPVDVGQKRKAESVSETNGHTEKRPRTEPEPEKIEVEDSVEAPKATEKPPQPPSDPVTTADPTKKPKGRRLPGPADETTDPEAIQMLVAHETEVFVCSWNPVTPELLATGSKDAIVHYWDVPITPEDGHAPPCTEPPRKLAYFAKPGEADLTSLDWNCDGTLLAIGSYDAILRVCHRSGALHYFDQKHKGPIFATRFSKSGRWLLTASLDGTTCVWDIVQKKLHRQYRCHLDCCLDIDWLDETTFASCGADKLIHVLTLTDPKPIRTFTGHANEINQIKCNPSRTRLASCSDDRTARIWNVENITNPSPEDIPGLLSSSEVVVLKGHKNAVSSIGWCPVTAKGQNELLATSGFDGTARLWDSVTGDCLKIFQDHKRPVYALTFSPNGRWLATGSGDGWLHVYDVKEVVKKWSWYAGSEKPGVYEIDWQQVGKTSRIALALESRSVAVIDATRIPAIRES
ncbi:hypothetical protein JAAARDRAFT_120290 [Jaapia argillacea MUCL 33604]|uniref:Anaphase-promoting complex subunit 4 WD40 domain-containing protein n=1 Tax=Jaapia argillacea MUCL 33604 TaxID=933084 RepID=A0A067QI12_9AGAM|nr:hypothetical protein JAAARDRAFT_120290 [Jaapia argillacea MUCL 33604]